MYDKNDTSQKIVAIVAEALNVDKQALTPDVTFEALGADSLDRLEMIMKIEDAFSIDITDDQEAKIKSIQDAIDAVHAMRSK